MQTLLELTEAGIQKAINGANAKVYGWSDTAFGHLLEYIQRIGPGGCFTVEQFRSWCKIEKKFEAPNSKRAFGGVVLKAAKEKLIFKDGYAQTESPTAHGAIAALWRIPQTKLLAA